MKFASTLIALNLLALVGVSDGASAQEHPAEHRRESASGHREQWRLDDRFHHDHYYPVRGYAMPALPNGSIDIGFKRDRFFFHAGVWMRPLEGRFVVVDPPVGIEVPILPGDSVTLWVAGAPYYYANGVYYTPALGGGYTVVAPPPGVDQAQPMPAPQGQSATKSLPAPIIYPRNGQSAAQTEADRQECYRWATSQANGASDMDAFPRAVDACMDARGYTLR